MGYQTFYFHGAPDGSLGLNSFANIAGFEHYVGKTEYNNDADFDGVWGIWDHLFLPFVSDHLNNIQTPFFSFVFTASSHHPYKIPDHLRDMLPEGIIPIHKSIAYVDYSIRAFFNSASKQKWFNNTLFVITGDHTCTSVYPEFKTSVGAYTVPIIFYQPGSRLIGRDSTPAQQIDIMPTILNYVGYRRPYFAFGQDLFAPDSSKFNVNYAGNSFQLINRDWVLQFDLEKTISMYCLKTDRLMKNNLVGKNMPVQKFLEKQIKAFIQQYNGRMVNNQLLFF
jgi:phosphoglycerol transferase MdoB-like AlkP superfamily enzyme